MTSISQGILYMFYVRDKSWIWGRFYGEGNVCCVTLIPAVWTDQDLSYQLSVQVTSPGNNGLYDSLYTQHCSTGLHGLTPAHITMRALVQCRTLYTTGVRDY